MQPISFDNQSYILDGQRQFLISGEIHYFRVARDAWRDRLEKLKAAGANCVATYVPWLLHEPTEGHFTFDGQLDVEAFLALCNEVGLRALVRPGPYQYSELAWHGLPGWLCENYPDLLARDIRGQVIRNASISYLHPLFIAHARRWYDIVIPRLAKHQTTCGGAVAAFQFDNELMGMHEWPTGGWDYNRETMGIGGDTGRWADFLRQKYGSPSAAAHAFGRSARSYAELIPLPADGTLVSRRMTRDYQECYFDSIADYAATLVGWMRSLGVDVPVVHNSGNAGMNCYFERLHRKLGAGFHLGSDHYYNLGLNWAQNNPTPQYALTCFTSLEQLRLLGGPATVFELPGGSASDFPPITAADAGVAYLANLAMGMKGWNYYIFAGGQNIDQTGTTSDLYDYGAALSPLTGECRPLYLTQQRFAAFVKQNQWLLSAQRAADVRVGMDLELCRAVKYGDAGSLLPARAAVEFYRNGLLATAFCAGASPELISLQQGDLPVDLPLVAVSCDSMSRSVQQRLHDFLARGGKLLLLGTLPTLDEDFHPCAILAELAAATQHKLDVAAARLSAAGIDNVWANGWLSHFEPLADGAEVVAEEARGTRRRYIVGFRRSLAGGGQFTVLGATWMQAMREHEAMLRNLLTPMGWRSVVRSSNPNVWTTLWCGRDGQSLLFALNLFTAPMQTSLQVRNAEGMQDLGGYDLPAMSVRVYHDGQLVDPLA